MCCLHCPLSDMFKHPVCSNQRLECKKGMKRVGGWGKTVALCYTEVSVLHTHSIPLCHTECISKALQQTQSFNVICIYILTKAFLKIWLKPDYAAWQDLVSLIQYGRARMLSRDVSSGGGAASSLNFCQYSGMLSPPIVKPHTCCLLPGQTWTRRHFSFSSGTPLSYSITPPIPPAALFRTCSTDSMLGTLFNVF